MSELRRVSSFLDLPSVVKDESARIYNFVLQRGLVRGRSMESVVAGSLYAACRRHDVPRTLDELGEASGIEKKEIGRGWAASVILSNIKGARTAIDSEIEAQLNHITKHFPDKVFKSDYFSVIDIDIELIHQMKCTTLEALFNAYIVKEFQESVQLKI
jgi:hypothetical protein